MQSFLTRPHQIKVAYNSNRGAYSFQFSKSGKYLTYLGELFMNSKLVTGDKPAWFKITKHHYELDKFTCVYCLLANSPC